MVVQKNLIGSVALAGSAVDTYLGVAQGDTKQVAMSTVKLLCDTTTGIVDFTLPEISDFAGFENIQIIVFDSGENASVSNITLRAGGTDQINGAATLVISADAGSVILEIANGNRWINVA